MVTFLPQSAHANYSQLGEEWDSEVLQTAWIIPHCSPRCLGAEPERLLSRDLLPSPVRDPWFKGTRAHPHVSLVSLGRLNNRQPSPHKRVCDVCVSQRSVQPDRPLPHGGHCSARGHSGVPATPAPTTRPEVPERQRVSGLLLVKESMQINAV